MPQYNLPAVTPYPMRYGLMMKFVMCSRTLFQPLACITLYAPERVRKGIQVKENLKAYPKHGGIFKVGDTIEIQ